MASKPMTLAQERPGWMAWAWTLSVIGLTISGLAQMPIFKRYYVADIPGLGWLADFYLTHKIHYAGAILFLFLVGYSVSQYLGGQRFRFRITLLGWARVLVLAGLVITGLLRAAKNLSSVAFDPLTVVIIDWTHLGMAILLLVLAIIVLFGPRRVRPKQ